MKNNSNTSKTDHLKQTKSPTLKLNKLPKNSSLEKDLKTTTSSYQNKSKDNLAQKIQTTPTIPTPNINNTLSSNTNTPTLKQNSSFTEPPTNLKIPNNISFINNDTELKILSLKKELNHRGLLIFEGIANAIELSRLDPILEVFKSNTLTHQFFIDRILEIIIVIKKIIYRNR